LPRPRKRRRVCRLPDNDGFFPVRGGEQLEPVVLSVDEYETIRLIDWEGLSQEQCGEYMCIARTTAQLIYTAARKKLSEALVYGKPIRICGGDYQLCDGNENYCGRRGCHRHRHGHVNSQGGKQ